MVCSVCGILRGGNRCDLRGGHLRRLLCGKVCRVGLGGALLDEVVGQRGWRGAVISSNGYRSGRLHRWIDDGFGRDGDRRHDRWIGRRREQAVIGKRSAASSSTSHGAHAPICSLDLNDVFVIRTFRFA